MIYVDNRYMELIADETNVSEEDERISELEAEAARLYIRAKAAEAALSRSLKRGPIWPSVAIELSLK